MEPEKLTINVSDFSLREMADAVDQAGDAAAGGFNFRQTAALAWIVKRRDDPTFTYEEALDLRISDLDIVGEPPEVPSGSTGDTLPRLLATGTSDPAP